MDATLMFYSSGGILWYDDPNLSNTLAVFLPSRVMICAEIVRSGQF